MTVDAAALRLLCDKQEITECLYLVARGIDRGDVDLVRSCYLPDATDYHGIANGAASKIFDILAQGRLKSSQHAISNILIRLEGDSTISESCFNAFHQSQDQTGQLWNEAMRGRYLDTFARDSTGAWKIARRVVLFDWTEMVPSGPTWTDHMCNRTGLDDRYIWGRRDRADMSYTNTLPLDLEGVL